LWWQQFKGGDLLQSGCLAGQPFAQPGQQTIAICGDTGGSGGRFIDIEIRDFSNLPLPGDPAPIAQLVVPVDKPFKNHGFDLAAGGIRGENGVEQAGVSDGGRDELIQAVRVAPGLFFIGGDPKIRLQQEKDDNYGNDDEGTSCGHFSPWVLTGPAMV